MEQVPASDGSAYQGYALNQKGRDLFPVIVAIQQSQNNENEGIAQRLAGLGESRRISPHKRPCIHEWSSSRWSANKKLATYSDQFRFARQPFGFRVR